MQTRSILRLTGADTRSFLQGLVTNDVEKLSDGLVYAALLTPQGKYMSDFFLVPDGDAVLLDAPAEMGDTLLARLNMYRLRASVEISPTALHLHRGIGAAPEDAFADPRHPDLGWRAYRDSPQDDDATDWDSLRVAHLVPEHGQELHGDSYILECGFPRLNGVDFRKGCYVGQEVTARMQHKTELRKGLRQVSLSAPVASGTEIAAKGKAIGHVHTVSGTDAIAYLRFDRISDEMIAADARVTVHPALS